MSTPVIKNGWARKQVYGVIDSLADPAASIVENYVLQLEATIEQLTVKNRRIVAACARYKAENERLKRYGHKRCTEDNCDFDGTDCAMWSTKAQSLALQPQAEEE